jgi:hypothetical protein
VSLPMSLERPSFAVSRAPPPRFTEVNYVAGADCPHFRGPSSAEGAPRERSTVTALATASTCHARQR